MTPGRMSKKPVEYEFSANADGRMLRAGVGGIVRDTQYYVNDLAVAEVLGNGIDRELSDLLDVAVAVYLADRLAPRFKAGGSQYEHNWQRQMNVTIPVRQLRLWDSTEVRRALQAALEYLTEDAWSFQFVQREPSRARVAEGVQFLFPSDMPRPISVALFSGGLDSLAGVAAEVAANSTGTLVLVSANTSRRTLPIQRHLIDEIRQRTGRLVLWTVAHFGMRRRNKRDYDGEERTQRTRGFAFAAVGAVSSLVANAESLQLYENGIGAINLPYSDVQIGAQSTRAMHPEAVQRMEHLIRVSTGRALKIELPHLFRTKAELCTLLKDSHLADLAASTVSCDSYPLRQLGAKQCGICTSCLLRRESLLSAGIKDDLSPRDSFGYAFDIYRRFGTLSANKRIGAVAMMDQAHRIRRAAGDPNAVSAETWPRLVREFPALLDLPEALATGSATIELARMFARYGVEFSAFADAIKATGTVGQERRS